MAARARTTAATEADLNLMLGLATLSFPPMLKKLLLASLIVMIGMWGAGYDLAAMKDDIWNVANKQAGAMSGRAQMDDSDWGSQPR